jgi:hypothetical protein
MWLTETNQLSLESIAGAFGDEVVASEKPGPEESELGERKAVGEELEKVI